VSNNVIGQYTMQFGKARDGDAEHQRDCTKRRDPDGTVQRHLSQHRARPGAVEQRQRHGATDGLASISLEACIRVPTPRQAQVMASLPADSATMQALLQTSGFLSWAARCHPIGKTKSTARWRPQLMKIEQPKWRTTNQAQLNWIAQQTQMIAQAQNDLTAASKGFHGAKHRGRQSQLRPLALGASDAEFPIHHLGIGIGSLGM